MNCRYCGTELPDEALFCPECGRAVNVNVDVVPEPTPEPMPVAASAGFSIADLAFSSPASDSDASSEQERDLPDGAGLDAEAAELRCPQCGELIAADDVFCGECGFVLRTVSPSGEDVEASETATVRSPDTAGDSANLPTSIIVLPDLITLQGTTETEPVEPVAYGALDALVDGPEEASVDELVHETPAQVAAASASAAPIDPDLEFDEPLPFALPMTTKATPSPRSRPIPDPFPWGTDRPLREDIEATRIIADPASGIRYVLQFSTGESVTVLGSGLVGRNPSMQPGEYVDQLVPIFDAGKSVSKTHLEYGQEGGRFWISDRYSTNGSTIRQPETEPRRADPGRRYFIARGTRVDLGEQFFVVS